MNESKYLNSSVMLIFSPGKPTNAIGGVGLFLQSGADPEMNKGKNYREIRNSVSCMLKWNVKKIYNFNLGSQLPRSPSPTLPGQCTIVPRGGDQYFHQCRPRNYITLLYKIRKKF